MSLARPLALAFPDRLSRRRDPSRRALAIGRRPRLPARSGLAAGPQRMARGRRSRRRSVGRAHPVRRGDRRATVARPVRRPASNPPRRRLRSRHRRGHADAQPPPRRDPPVVRPRSQPDRRDRSRRCSTGFASMALTCCPGTSAASQLRHRAAFAHRYRSRDSASRRRGARSSAPTNGWRRLLDGKRRLGDIRRRRAGRRRSRACSAMRRCARLDPARPGRFRKPGRQPPLRSIMPRPAGPTVEVRAQALFGLAQHPTVAGGRVPLTLAITSPAGPADPDDEGPARLLGGQLARCRQGNARPLPQASLARRPSGGGADADAPSAQSRLLTGTIKWA